MFSAGSVAQDLVQQSSAAEVDVVPGGLEVTGVPGVRDVAIDACVFEQEAHLLLVVFPDDAVAPAAIHLVHEDDVVVVFVLLPGHLVGVVPFTGNAVFVQHTLRRRVDRVADLLCGNSRRSDLELTNSAIGLLQMLPWQTNRILVMSVCSLPLRFGCASAELTEDWRRMPLRRGHRTGY